MLSTKPTHMLASLVDTLQSQGLKSHNILHQASLLAAWSWCSQHRPELGLPAPKDRPGITVAMKAMREALDTAIGSSDMDTGLLEMNCTGRAVQELQEKTAHLEWLDAESLIKELASLAEHTTGQQAGVNPLPLELAQLMVTLGRTAENQVVAAYPQGDLLMALSDKAAERTYVSQSHTLLSEALILICGASMMLKDRGDPLLHADVVLSAPPMGAKVLYSASSGKQRSRRMDAVGLQEAYELATHRAVVLLPTGTLYDMAEYALREELVRDNVIDIVIQLPDQTLLGTTIPPVLVVLDKKRQQGDSITFVDASRLMKDDPTQSTKKLQLRYDFWEKLNQIVINPINEATCRQVSQSEIESNDFDLSVNRYVMGIATQKINSQKSTHPLNEVAEIVRAQTLKGEEGEDGKLFIEIGGRDINASGQISIQEPVKELNVAGRTRKRAEQQQLRPGDVLLISKGSIGRVALVGNNCGNNWIAGQVFFILRAKEHIVRPEYLYRYLSSPMVQQYLEEIASGTGIPILKANDIKYLSVPLPSLQDQESVIDVHHQIMEEYAAIWAHQKEIEELSQQHWPI